MMAKSAAGKPYGRAAQVWEESWRGSDVDRSERDDPKTQDEIYMAHLILFTTVRG